MSRLKDLFKKSTNESAKTEEINEAQFGPSVPEGLWVKCPKCGELLYKEDVVKNSEYMSEIHGEFQKIVDAVMDNKEIVDELEQIIGQFKI